MADRERERERDRLQPHQLQVHPQHPFEGGRYGAGKGPMHITGERGPSVTKILAVLTSLPVGGSLLGLSGITLVGTLIGLAVATPLFIIFSPVIVPAAIVIGLAVTGFLASGAFGLTALTSLSWVLNYIQQSRTLPEHADMAKRRMQDMAGYVGQKTKDVGQQIQSKAHEGRTGEGRT